MNILKRLHVAIMSLFWSLVIIFLALIILIPTYSLKVLGNVFFPEYKEELT